MLDKLTQKVGPLPLWVYGVGIAVGIIVARRLLASKQDTTGQAVDTNSADGGYYDPSTGEYFPASGSASGVSGQGTGYTTAAQVIETDEGTVIIPPTGQGTYGDPIIIPHVHSGSGGNSTDNTNDGRPPDGGNGIGPARTDGSNGTSTTTDTTAPVGATPAPPSYSVPIRVLPPEGAIPSLGTSPSGKILGPGPVWE